MLLMTTKATDEISVESHSQIVMQSSNVFKFFKFFSTMMYTIFYSAALFRVRKLGIL